jgi:hypothetical protein
MLATLADVIVAPAASRVFSGSPFGYGHEPAGSAALEFVTVLPVGVLVLLQPARTTPAAKIRLGHTIFLVPITLSFQGRALSAAA